MDNSDIACVFRAIADLLEQRKDSRFKIRAYRKVADSIDRLEVPVERLAVENRLREIPGVGKAIEKKVTELAATGTLEYYERLRAEHREEAA